MEQTVQTLIGLCEWDASRYLVFSDNVFGVLVYYSHFIALIPALFFGIFVLQTDIRKLLNRLLFLIMAVFSIWIVLDLILWANEKPELIMFVWASMIFIEPLVYALSVYVLDVFVNKVDVSFKKKLVMFLPLVPILVLMPTKLVVQGFDLTNCDRETVEGFIALYYVYAVEIFYVFWILFFSFKEYKRHTAAIKKQLIYLASGIILFLVSFASGNIIGSTTENWTVAQVGLLGMPILIGFLAFAVIRFGIFNTKIISTQVLVFSLSFLVGSLLFVVEDTAALIVSGITFLLSILFGSILIRTVQHEISLREQLQRLATDISQSNKNLELANVKLRELDRQKSEFMSFATHQLRSPLTAMKGYSSLILDGDYGEVSADVRDAVNKIHDSANTLTNVVNDYLNTSRIELGGMQYVMRVTDLRGIVHELVEAMRPTYEAAGVTVSFHADAHSKYLVNVDTDKIRQVISNIIDNSIKYTPQGAVTVTLSKDLTHNKIMLEVKDNGIGISKEVISKLFSKFTRADNASKVNIRGTGLGLYLAKQLIEAMHGEISAESAGEGKGSRFCLVLPAEPIMKR